MRKTAKQISESVLVKMSKRSNGRKPVTKAAFIANRVQRKLAEMSQEAIQEEEEEEEEAGNPVTMDEVRSFIRSNTSPEDYELHSWAEGKGVSPHAAEELLYQLAAQQVTGKKPVDTSEGGPEEDESEKEGSFRFRKWAKDLIPGGKAAGKPSSVYPEDQIQMGVKVEKEHTPDPLKAEEIAKDHLEEFPNYYTALNKMEKRLEQKKEATMQKTASQIADIVIHKLAAENEKQTRGRWSRPGGGLAGAFMGGAAGAAGGNKGILELIKLINSPALSKHQTLLRRAGGIGGGVGGAVLGSLALQKLLAPYNQ